MDREIRRIAREDEALGRLMTIPGVGELTAMAVHTFAPPMESFRNGRDFAAWVGLTPRESSTGGRQRLGRITKMGQRDIRRLLALEDTSASWRPRLRRFEARPDRTGIRPPLRARSALDRTGG